MANNAFENPSFYNKRYSSNSFMRSYEIEYENGDTEYRIDYSDYRLRRLINSIKSYKLVTYNGEEKFTTFVWRYYGTTTVYRIIMIYNGFMHPYEIVPGQAVKMPLPADLERIIDSLDKPRQQIRSAVI